MSHNGLSPAQSAGYKQYLESRDRIPTIHFNRMNVHDIMDALERVGFFYLEIPEDKQCGELLTSAMEFFADNSKHYVGFALDENSTGYSTDAEDFHDPDIADVKETFDLNFQGDDQDRAFDMPLVAHAMAMRRIASAVSRLIVVGLGESPRFNEYLFSHRMSGMYRAIRYPGNAGTGIGEHTDYGFLTLVYQDSVGGLQIKLGSEWIDVEPRPNTFVVNSGEMLEFMSGGKLKPTVHRVVGSDQPRQSVVFFHNPNDDAVIRNLAAGDLEFNRHTGSFKAGDYLDKRYNQTYNHRNKTTP